MISGNRRAPVIAVDGPAGAGKSTVARKMAHRLGLLYLDTGAMYRGLAWKALHCGADLRDEPNLEDLLQRTSIDLYRQNDGTNEVLVDGQNVTGMLRGPEINASVSLVAGVRGVREEMVKRQRAMAEHGGVVMDGRDIGTFVLPDADLKFFLTASLTARAMRRHKDLLAMGYDVNLDVLSQEIEHRDHLDSSRTFAPLAEAPDAIVIDTTNVEVDRVVDDMIAWYHEKTHE